MLLQRLAEYAQRPGHDLLPTLYVAAPVRYIIELDGAGRLLSPLPVDTANPDTPQTRRGVRRPVPQVQRSSGVKPLLLADNAEYTFGLARLREKPKPERVAAAHEAYMGLLDRCVKATHHAAAGAVLAFLSADPVTQLELADDFDRGATISFRVDGRFVVDVPAVQSFWAMENDPALKDAPIRQCLVCGEERPVLERLQAKIKGVPGGQTAGTAIISANAEAFTSYGLAASLIAPTCVTCGERFTRAANELLSDQSSRIVLGGAAFIFWTKEPVGFDFRGYLDKPRVEQVHDLLNSLRSGGRRSEIKVDATSFYAAVLSGSGGRTAVRDWIDTTVGEAKRHLATWFERQRIVGLYGHAEGPLGVYQLAAATVRDAAKDLAPPTPRALVHAALSGTPLPLALLYQAVRRNRAEQGITRQRAALIKLVLRSHEPSDKEDRMVQLDLENPSAAYRCGRLLAVLEEVQRLAMPGIRGTIVDRFFGTASSAPASVFGRLVRGAQPHLAKLERDRPGAYRALQRRLEEIQAGISGFPRTLTLEHQGIFALGYYHQRAFDRAQAMEAKERRRAGVVPAGVLADAEQLAETDDLGNDQRNTESEEN